jgi:hypothetical protein
MIKLALESEIDNQKYVSKKAKNHLCKIFFVDVKIWLEKQ